MRFPKLGVLLAITLATLGLTPPAHAQIPPDTYVPVAVCVVVGTVHLDDGVVVPFAAEAPEDPPPLADDEGPTGYQFSQVAMVCAGLLSGVCHATSSGTTAGGNPLSGFTGTFGLNCDAPSNQTCNRPGDTALIGGPPLTGSLPPPPPPLPPGFPDGNWSFSGGPLLLASLDEITCTPLLGLPAITDADGIFAAVAAPFGVPSILTPLTPTDPAGTCEDAQNTEGESTFGLPVALVWCNIAIAGVGVILQDLGDPDGG
jgi:hypothetical protein